MNFVAKAVDKIFDIEDSDEVELLEDENVRRVRETREFVRVLVYQKQDIYLAELQHAIYCNLNVFLSLLTISLTLKTLCLSCKVMTSLAERLLNPDVKQWEQEYLTSKKSWDSNNLFFYDEMGKFSLLLLLL